MSGTEVERIAEAMRQEQKERRRAATEMTGAPKGANVSHYIVFRDCWNAP